MKLKNRYLNIDTIRILSILIVMLSHFSLLAIPYFDGTIGVVLFFMVSGYCIAMTTPAKLGFFSFWKARYARLLPLFFLSALVIQLVKVTFPESRPDRMTTWRQYFFTNFSLPAFDFPTYFLFGGDYTFVDGSFWSLLVELRFYLLFSIIWYILRLKKSAPFVLLSASFVCFFTDKYYSSRINDFFMYLPFFAFGMSYFEFDRGSKKLGLAGGLLSLLTFSVFSYFKVKHVSISLSDSFTYSYLACFFVFIGIMVSLKNVEIRFQTLIARLAFLTYPIYLLHNEIGLISIELLKRDLGPFLSGIAAIFVAVILAHVLDLTVNYLARAEW